MKKVYVLTCDGYVKGAFKSLSKFEKAFRAEEPLGILTGADVKQRKFSLWNLQKAFRDGNKYVSVVTEYCHFELTKVGVC